MPYFHEGPVQGHITEKIGREKSPVNSVIQTKDRAFARHGLYHCAITVV